MKKTICVMMATLTIILTLCSCGKKDVYTPAGNGGTQVEMSEKTVDKNIEHKSLEKDDNIGLMSIKINSAGKYELNKTEKLLVQYFDTDYEWNVEYNALQRYPQVYLNTQISFVGKVKKMIETNNDGYTALMQYAWYSSYNDVDTNYVVIKGTHGDARIIEGDYVLVYGKYTGVDSYSVDGTSYSVPTVLVNRFTFGLDNNGGEGFRDLYSQSDIKQICRYIFGDDITVRLLNDDDSFDYADDMSPYVCVLDNQSNANFSKYVLDGGGGCFIDMNSDDGMSHLTGIFIDLFFSADFEHFYIKKLDTNLETYSIQCYDKKLKRIWSRDFEETTSEVIDYTPDHIYLVANGSMYILDALTGENATNPTYVGQKDFIRKVEDGILLIQGNTKSDAVMKTDLLGNVRWTANTKIPIYAYQNDAAASIQIPDDNYRIFYSGFTSEPDEYGNVDISDRVLVLEADGTVVYDAESF